MDMVTTLAHMWTPHSIVSSVCLMMYTDPGSGAMMWQILASSVVLVGFYYSRLINWVKRLTGSKSKETEGTQGPDSGSSAAPR